MQPEGGGLLEGGVLQQIELVGGKDMDYAFLDFISCQILTLLLSPARLLLRLQGVCSSSLFWSLTLNFEF